MARCVQHETDHLDGVLFIDRLDRAARKAAMKEIRQAPWYDETAPPTVKLSPHPVADPFRPGHWRVRLVFAGTPAVALPTLDALTAAGHDLLAVVTRPDAPTGRGRRLGRSPVADWADARETEVLTPARIGEPEFLDRLRALAPDC